MVQALVDRGADVNQANVCAACVRVARALWPQHTEGWLALPVYDVVFVLRALAVGRRMVGRPWTSPERLATWKWSRACSGYSHEHTGRSRSTRAHSPQVRPATRRAQT